MISTVPASEVRAGDEIVIRNTMGKISSLIKVIEAGPTCSDFSQIHIMVESARFVNQHIGKLGRVECWFRDSELEIKRADG